REFGSMREIAAGGLPTTARITAWAERQPAAAYRPLAELTIGPAVPDPGAIYTIGHNYRAPEALEEAAPERPLVYGKAANSVTGHGATVRWDRSLTDNVDAEVELGVVIGARATAVSASQAMNHVFGYTCIDDISSRDEWLDGDQWLLGKSMPGFCPVGPWIVTSDDLEPDDLPLGCTINGAAIQDGRTSQMRSSIPDLIAYLSLHVTLEPGDLIATGTPHRLTQPPGPGRRLRAGDEVTVRIEGIGELTNFIA
ncbi:MAG: fumarylacetoacetate hydrolase family protein, partial [Chloroflexota bacterium]|nr:fumarylacetoacetate hydrolase family protein [Chloroflexota bacterium]